MSEVYKDATSIAAVADRIAAMADKVRTESDSKKTEVKKTTSTGDGILEYTTQDGSYPLNLTDKGIACGLIDARA